MKIALLSLAVALAALCASVFADDPPAAAKGAAADQSGIVLEEPAQTVAEAMERRSEQEAEARKTFEAARKAFEERMAAANQKTVADLEVIARRAVADGKLADAAKAWQEVLRLDPENEGAKAFFRTIGRNDVLASKTNLSPVHRDLLGMWKWVSGTEIELMRDGTTVMQSQNGLRRGAWKYDPARKMVLFFDSQGHVTDRLNITHGGRMLEGYNHSAGHVWGVKID